MLVVRNQILTGTIKIDNYYMKVTNLTSKIKKYEIVTQWGHQEIVLGRYKTKKRCLEILDEMDKALEKQNSKCNTRVVDSNGNVIKNYLSNHYFNIYYMPKK
jgi:hypothetical protein